jgi:TRAP-type C4-dicarboxylate transport system substrate-binding protein
LLPALVLATTPALAAREVRFATIAPKNSTWGKILHAWEQVVDKKTHGELKPIVYYNGVLGDESAMVAKMRTGQLDGAALSAAGLSLIYRDVMVLQFPGVTNSWPLRDLVIGMLGPEIENGFRREGFELLAWGDIGLVYQMSHGVAVRGPGDLRGRRPLVWRNEPIGPMIYSLIGQVVPIPLGSTEVLPALQAGTVDIVAAPALAAEQLQWTPYVDHISEQVIVCAISGTLMRRDRLEAIPADARHLLTAVQNRMAKAQTAMIRRLDAEAVQRLRRKMTVVRSSDDDKVEWYRVFLKAVRRLRQGVFSPDLVDRVLSITGKG